MSECGNDIALTVARGRRDVVLEATAYLRLAPCCNRLLRARIIKTVRAGAVVLQININTIIAI